jgi:N-hydroxyarylamine O-acetyltransferase
MPSSFLDLYFERIRYAGSPRADLRTLRELHLLHLQNIPYENVDVFCHQGVRLDRDSLVQRILLRRRGGYCFQQNGLFAAALAGLGFRFHPNLARVHRNRPAPGGRTHHVNLVELDGETWLCDVGFGGSGFRHPLLLKPDLEQEQLSEIYRLHESDVHGFYLQKKISRAHDWEPLYTFKIDAALPVDLEMANFYTANSDDHVFRGGIIGTRMTERGRVTVSDHSFKVFDLVDGTLKKTVATEFPAYLESLREHLGVELNDAETTLFKARFGALKPPAAE